MQRSTSTGYLVYPLLVLALFSVSSTLHAQQPTGTAPSQGQEAPAPPPAGEGTPDAVVPAPPNPQEPSAETPPQSSSSARQGYPNEQERVRLAREAQARVQARRKQRIEAVIQDTYSHKYEVSFGYAYLRLRPGHSLQHVTEYGWNANITEFIRPKLGITADFRGYYGTAYTGAGNGYALFKPFISNYNVLGGPEYRFATRKNWAVSGQVLAGVSRNLFQGDSEGFPGTLLGLYPNQWRFSAAVAAPIDYNLGPGLAVRITPNYLLTTMGGDIQHNLGFNAGLNYRFGPR